MMQSLIAGKIQLMSNQTNTPHPSKRDQVYAQPRDHLPAFAFDEHVADVFSDMIGRSVPGYAEIIQNIQTITHRYAQPDSNLYDLGCSLGAATLAMRHGVRDMPCKIIGIDNSEPMISRCQAIVNRDPAQAEVELVCGDIFDQAIRNASVVTMNFTLQFVAPNQRQQLLQTIYDGLRPGGALILSEKITFEDQVEDEHMVALHHDFKRANGYSDLEISQKRTALENVMIPDTLETHAARAQTVGFSTCNVWFRCYNFVSMLLLK